MIQLQGQLTHAQDLGLRQQDAIAKLQTALDAEVAALREERATRAAETSIRMSETSAAAHPHPQSGKERDNLPPLIS